MILNVIHQIIGGSFAFDTEYGRCSVGNNRG